MTLYREEELVEDMRAQMWSLYEPYHHITRLEFEQRLATLDRIAVFTSARRQRVIGIVGMRYRLFQRYEESFLCLYFGLVFIDPKYRNRFLIQRLVTIEYIKHKLVSPRQHMMFWADALTYRPHLLMMNYLQDYHPHPEHDMPEHIRELLIQIGQHYYGERFDEQTCTVIKDKRTLKDELSRISEQELEHPGIRFYAHCNPEHTRGDGLLIICPLHMRNLIHFLGRVVDKTLASFLDTAR